MAFDQGKKPDETGHEEVGRALQSIATASAQTPDLGHVLQVIMAQVAALFSVEAGSLILLDEETGELRFERALSDGLQRMAPYRLRVGQGIAGWVVQHAQSLLVPDVQEDPRFYASMDQLSGFQTRSILCVPLLFEGRAIGAIELINNLEGPFTEEDQVRLETLAAPAAAAIRSAILYGRFQRQVALLDSMHTIAVGLQSSQDTAEATATYVRGAQDLGFPWVELLLVSRDQRRLEPASHVVPPDLLETCENLLGDRLVGREIPLHPQSVYQALTQMETLATDERDAQLIQARQVFPVDLLRGRFWPDEPSWSRSPLLLSCIPYEHWLALPVPAETRLVGALLLAREHPLASEHTGFLHTFTGLLGQTLGRLEAEGRIRQRNRELTMLIESSASMSAVLDPEELLEVIGRLVTNAASMDQCQISDWDPDTGRLINRLRWSRSQDQALPLAPEDPFVLRELEAFPLVEQVMESRLAQAVERRQTLLSSQEEDFLRARQWQQWILLPMITRGQVIGLIELGDPAPHLAIGAEEMRLCRALSEHAAVTLQNSRLFAAEATIAEENARLLEAARLRARQLELISKIAQATTSVQEEASLMHLATTLIQENLGYPYVALAVVEGNTMAVQVRGPQKGERRTDQSIQGVLGWVMAHGEPLLLPEARTDPRYRHDPLLDEGGSQLAVPLLVDDQVLGVLDLRSAHPGVFGPQDLRMIQPLADHLALALSRVRLLRGCATIGQSQA